MELHELQRLYLDILGPFPDPVPLEMETLEEEDCGSFTRALIAWNNDAAEREEGHL